MHPFERSGLGIAPFRCVGVTENVFVMADGSTKAGGTCSHCGTGIRFEFHIRSSDDRKFKVGCDCVAKTEREYGADVEGFRAMRLEHAKARREAGAAARRAARRQEWEIERQERQAQRLAETAGWREENAALVGRLQAYNGDNEFLRAMKASLEQWGQLLPRQQAAVENNFATQDRIERQRQTSRHVGTVGQRIKAAKARVTRAVQIGKEPFYPFAPRYCITLEDDSGNCLVWFTSKGIRPFEEFSPCAFTVKDHGEYRDVRQTVVTRLMWKD